MEVCCSLRRNRSGIMSIMERQCTSILIELVIRTVLLRTTINPRYRAPCFSTLTYDTTLPTPSVCHLTVNKTRPWYQTNYDIHGKKNCCGGIRCCQNDWVRFWFYFLGAVLYWSLQTIGLADQQESSARYISERGHRLGWVSMNK